MLLHARCIGAVLAVIFIIAAPFPVSAAGPPEPEVPPGFHLVLSAPGVQLYRKDYNKGNPDFVQVIDLSRGASLELLHGTITDQRTGEGVYGGDDPRFESQRLQKYWNQVAAENSAAFCVTNGQFFYMKEYPTRLPFSLKKDGLVVTDGYGINDFPGLKLMLEIWPDRVNITGLSQAALYTSTAPDIIAGLSEHANKKAKHNVGRTFTGIDDRDHDGRSETLLIFNTLSAKQVDAAEVLRSFGADRVMMLDGGGSTQLLCQGQDFVYSERLIPQAIAVLAGPPLFQSAYITRQPHWSVLVEDERYYIDLEIQNRGTIAWKAGEVHLAVQHNPWGPDERLPLQQDIAPGEIAFFRWDLPPFPGWGIFTAGWNLESAGERFPEVPALFQAIILPPELEDRRPALLGKINVWTEQQVPDLKPLVQQWIQEQLHPPLQRLSLKELPKSRQAGRGLEVTASQSISRMEHQFVPDRQSTPPDASQLDVIRIVFVPVALLPLAAILFAVIQRRRRTGDS